MGRFVTTRRDLYTSKAASVITSETFWTGDAEAISVFARGSPSTTTLQGSNAEGRTATIAENSWSNLSTILSPSPDMIDIESGFRWFRALRSETTELVIQLQNRV